MSVAEEDALRNQSRFYQLRNETVVSRNPDPPAEEDNSIPSGALQARPDQR